MFSNVINLPKLKERHKAKNKEFYYFFLKLLNMLTLYSKKGEAWRHMFFQQPQKQEGR